MKTFCKKLLILLLSAVSVVCLALGLAACNPTEEPDNGNSGNNEIGTEKLNTPMVSLTRDVLSWEKISHADNYEIFEDGKSITTQEEITYQIPEKEVGVYNYTVKATSKRERYTDSDLSDSIQFTVVRLERPEIVSIENGVITWNKVENASSYIIFQNGVSISATAGLKYNITANYADTYSYYIVADSESHAFVASEPSEFKEYKVPLTASILVNSADDFPLEKISVEFSGDNIQPMSQTSLKKSGQFTDVSFNVSSETNEYGTYIAKAVDLPEGYVSTWARITRSSVIAEIRILKEADYEKIELGECELTAGNIDDRTNKLFIADEESKYSIRTEDGDNNDLSIYIGDELIANAENGLFVGVFEAGQGEAILLSFSSNAGGEYSVELVKGELPQFLRIGSYRLDENNDPKYENPNTILGSCIRYIKVEEDVNYKIMFFTATMGTATVKFKIKDKVYEFTGGEADLALFADDAEQIDDNGTFVKAIKIEIEVAGVSGVTGNIAFCIYNPQSNTPND